MDEKSQKDLYKQKYPATDFKETIYSFTSSELRKMQSLDTMVQMGQLAEVMISSILQNEALKRVNAQNSPDVGILYDVPAGNFTVYSPKVWCSQCKSRKAEFSYKGQVYCKTCAEVLRASQPQAPTMPVKEKKEAKKK